MTLAYERLEYRRPNALLIVLVRGHYLVLLFFRHLVVDHLVGQNSLAVFAGEEAVRQLLYLALEAFGGVLGTLFQVHCRILTVLFHHVLLGEEDLHDRVHVARVAKVLHARV